MYQNRDGLTDLKDVAYNTDQLLQLAQAAGALTPGIDYNLIQIVPPASPAPPATQLVNYVRQAPLPAPLGTIRQLTILYDAAGNIDTVTRTI